MIKYKDVQFDQWIIMRIQSDDIPDKERNSRDDEEVLFHSTNLDEVIVKSRELEINNDIFITKKINGIIGLMHH